MNKTVAFVSLAGVLALAAVVLGLPTFSPPVPVPIEVKAPLKDSGALRMTGRLSHPYLPTGTSDLFATVDITGVEVPGAARRPVNLALVIDRSSSMRGYKLQQAREAARHLVGLLGSEDWLSIVHYGSDVRALGAMPASASNRQLMLAFIDNIWDEGGTNISAGLQEGRAQVKASACQACVERLILMSDGQPTEGLTSDAQLLGLVQDIRAAGITVSALGVGTDFNEDLMQGFAERGAGAYGFIEDARELGPLFQKDLRQAATSVARDVVLSFTLPPGVDLKEVLGYRAEQSGRRVTVRLPDFSSGQLERVVVQLTVHDAQADQPLDITEVSLGYWDLRANDRSGQSVKLAAQVTSRPEEVAARQDKEATVNATRALSAKNLTRAAEALSEGHKEEAKGYVERNQELFEQAGAVASPSAVAGDMAEQKALLRDYEQAGEGESVDAVVKQTKSKSLKSFGRLGSTY